MRYRELKDKCQKRIDDLPIFFAFDKTQFEKGKRKLGVKHDKELVRIGIGGFMREVDSSLLEEAIEANEREIGEFLSDDDNLKAALVYELANHEYCISYDSSEALSALDLDGTDERVARILQSAINQYMESVEW